jgi:hypothetical protein
MKTNELFRRHSVRTNMTIILSTLWHTIAFTFQLRNALVQLDWNFHTVAFVRIVSP